MYVLNDKRGCKKIAIPFYIGETLRVYLFINNHFHRSVNGFIVYSYKINAVG